MRPCTRYVALRAAVLSEWEEAGVDAQQLVGPHLAVGLIDQTLRQCAGQIAPVEDRRLDEIKHAALLPVDETPWRENGQLLWLWVFSALSTVVYFMGPRRTGMFVNALQRGFQGNLMSDGYLVYRIHANRLRCLAHLLRKALGLSKATCHHTSKIGRQLLEALADLIRAAQEVPTDSAAWLAGQQAPRLAELWALCERHQHSSSSKLGEFCRERLNDWSAIVRPQSALDPQCRRAHLAPLGDGAKNQLRHPQRAGAPAPRRSSPASSTPAVPARLPRGTT